MRLACCIAAVVASACALPAVADTIDVEVIDSEFAPDPTINLGDTIRWVWNANLPHTTTSVEGIAESWSSAIRSTPFEFEHTFTNVGEFWYYCELHGFDNGDGTAGGMAGIITVVPEPATLGLLAIGALGLRRRRA